MENIFSKVHPQTAADDKNPNWFIAPFEHLNNYAGKREHLLNIFLFFDQHEGFHSFTFIKETMLRANRNTVLASVLLDALYFLITNKILLLNHVGYYGKAKTHDIFNAFFEKEVFYMLATSKEPIDAKEACAIFLNKHTYVSRYVKEEDLVSWMEGELTKRYGRLNVGDTKNPFCLSKENINNAEEEKMSIHYSKIKPTTQGGCIDSFSFKKSDKQGLFSKVVPQFEHDKTFAPVLLMPFHNLNKYSGDKKILYCVIDFFFSNDGYHPFFSLRKWVEAKIPDAYLIIQIDDAVEFLIENNIVHSNEKLLFGKSNTHDTFDAFFRREVYYMLTTTMREISAKEACEIFLNKHTYVSLYVTKSDLLLWMGRETAKHYSRSSASSVKKSSNLSNAPLNKSEEEKMATIVDDKKIYGIQYAGMAYYANTKSPQNEPDQSDRVFVKGLGYLSESENLSSSGTYAAETQKVKHYINGVQVTEEELVQLINTVTRVWENFGISLKYSPNEMKAVFPAGSVEVNFLVGKCKVTLFEALEIARAYGRCKL